MQTNFYGFSCNNQFIINQKYSDLTILEGYRIIGKVEKIYEYFIKKSKQETFINNYKLNNNNVIISFGRTKIKFSFNNIK